MSDQRFSAAPVLAKLLPFQRASVDRIVDIFYRQKSGTRYLVADETGLGKSVVARGVVARAIEELQDDPTVDRIDIVYICSNADVGRQNVKRLDVLGTRVNLSTRLSLLATTTHQLHTPAPGVGKPVNLVSLTPRTAFPDKGWRTGSRDERALLFLILARELNLRGRRETAAYRILRGSMDWQRFKDHTRRYADSLAANGTGDSLGLDPTIVATFLADVATTKGHGLSLLDRFVGLVDDTAGRSEVPAGKSVADEVVKELRSTLARAGVEALEPDLVILDEFQRFTELLDADQPVSELAHQMFDYSAARVLLLSATPYKPFDLDEPVDGTAPSTSTGGHREQFLGTLDFLLKGRTTTERGLERVSQLLNDFRDTVTRGQDPTEVRDNLREALLTVMCRTERPAVDRANMVRERHAPASAVTAADIDQFIRLSELADHLDTRLPLDVWKSVPALVHFMADHYQLGRSIAKNGADPVVRRMLEGMDRLDPLAIDAYEPIAHQNPRLQTLIDQTLSVNWHQMLWMPPSQPYLRPGGPYASFQAQSMTKKLVFSQWSATPTAVASLLSYEASRRIARSDAGAASGVTAAKENVSQRLQYRRSGGDLSAMTSFMLFFPLPGLADRAGPLQAARRFGPAADLAAAEALIAEELSREIPSSTTVSTAPEATAALWRWPLMLTDRSLDDALSSGPVADVTPESAMAGQVDDPDDPDAPDQGDVGSALSKYLAEAIAVHRGAATDDLGPVPADLAVRTARLAMHSPANCAWRALGRLSVDTSQVTTAGRWRAAAVLASGLRTLFNRWESSLILDELYGTKTPYWQRVLQYCADGNLQAVLDEYVYHLADVEGDGPMTDEKLVRFALRASMPLKLNTAIYKGRDPLGGDGIDFRSRFAMRYGDNKQDDQAVRSTDIREAFNSPFWPFVLVSTSVGQEGIDFHPWCHNLVHWNVPGNPVDFEQRDGRVNRHRGHAVRRNIALAHGSEMIKAENPWDEAYSRARADAPHPEIPGLAPDWVYPGPHKVFRDTLPYQLSTDEARIDRVKKRVAYYRLAFGQARQDDLISVLTTSGVTPEQAEQWRVDLRP